MKKVNGEIYNSITETWYKVVEGKITRKLTNHETQKILTKETKKWLPTYKGLERCGYCGRYFIGNNHLYAEDLKKYTEEELNNAPLGYCPDAGQEHQEQNPEQMHQVTRDMATDACDPSLEGQWI